MLGILESPNPGTAGWRPWAAGVSPVLVRAVRPRDAAAVDQFFMNLSPQSRQRRFHAGVRGLSASQLERFTHPDWCHEAALIAVVADGGREVCIGEARYSLSDHAATSREFALAVSDEWQRRGVGRRLLQRLIRHAEYSGVALLYGDVIRDNLPMVSLAEALDFRPGRHPEDASLVRVVRSFAAVSNRLPGFAADRSVASAALAA